TTIFADTMSFPGSNWTKVSFEFLAPNNGKFVTVQGNGGDATTSWTLLDNFRFETPTSINSNTENSLGVVIFPNPFKNKLFIKSENSDAEINKINIINTLGQ